MKASQYIFLNSPISYIHFFVQSGKEILKLPVAEVRGKELWQALTLLPSNITEHVPQSPREKKSISNGHSLRFYLEH